MMPIAMSMGWVMAGASAADLATTEMALRRPGLAEANPMMREPATRAILKVGSAALVIVACRELKQRKHGRAAKVLAFAATAVWAGAAVNNVVQMNRRTR